jgi:uncharacterized protein (TIGR02271 family)
MPQHDDISDHDRLAVITDRHGARGTLDPSTLAERDPVWVQFEDGTRTRIARDALSTRADGTFHYEGTFEAAPAGAARVVEEHRLPLAEETLKVTRRTRETGRVRITKKVREHLEQIDEPVYEEEVEIERVAVGRIVDGPVPIREEGEVTIIPVLEERLVVQKQLVLKEELHVRKRRHQHRDERAVTLRREEAVVDREDLSELDTPNSPPNT